MRTVLCTLFNIKYLDKGLVLYDSLLENAKDFILYVLAMDETTEKILRELRTNNLVVIPLSDFESDKVRAARANRSIGEYFFTCTPLLIEYVLTIYKESICTYIDADIFFYSDPKILIDEMSDSAGSVQVIGHRFNWFERHKIPVTGKYCVEFNTFSNTADSLFLLKKWSQYCLETCRDSFNGVICADQAYLNDWCDKYAFVNEIKNLGAGIAPWNLNQYVRVKRKEGTKLIHQSGEEISLVFFHFENLQYIDESLVNANAFHYWGCDIVFFRKIYQKYLILLKNKKRWLKENYGVDILIKKHPAIVDPDSQISRMRRYKEYLTLKGFIRLCMIDLPTKLFLKNNYFSLDGE